MSKHDRGGARHPIVELTLARVHEFVREPEAVFWAFVFPIVLSVVLAAAFPSRGVQPVRVGIAPGAAAASIRDRLAKTPGIVIRDIPDGGAQRALREGDVHVIVVPTTPPTYQFDAARSESHTARLAVDDALKRAAGRADPWVAPEEAIDVPGSRYVDWLIPGMVAMGIMSNSMWGVGFSIVQARMRKLLKRMVASPMRKHEFLLGQLLARLLFLPPEVGVPFAFGVIAFGMPMRGSLWAVAAVTLIGSVAFGALGLLLGSRARTLEAISGLMNIAMLPMWLVSGVFFPASNFPERLQPAIRALPLTALVDALRAIVLEGASLPAVRNQILVLSAWTIVPFILALRIFRWR